MIVLELIFWISIGLVVWSYLGYPVLLAVLAPKSHSLDIHLNEYPDVDVIFAAYNEESVIEEKIHSIYKGSYPSEKIHVHIGSDASSDDTDAIVIRLTDKYPTLHLHRMPGRTGKSGIINHLVSITSSPIILASDANIFFEESMIQRMVANLMIPDVALVGGNIIYRDARAEGIAQEENFYLGYENTIKSRESSLWGLALGVEGGCYMIEREAYRTIPPLTFMEDFFMTMSVLKQGHGVQFDAQAICTEDVSVDRIEEFKRKIRISTGNFQNLSRFSTMAVTHFWPLGFAFISHKIIRWITPLLILINLVCAGLIAVFDGGSIYQLAFLAHLFLMLIFGLDSLFPRITSRSSLIRFVGHFYLMNFALLKGLIIYLQGVDTNVWQPTKRAQKRS